MVSVVEIDRNLKAKEQKSNMTKSSKDGLWSRQVKRKPKKVSTRNHLTHKLWFSLDMVLSVSVTNTIKK